jgi:hypothetical protein
VEAGTLITWVQDFADPTVAAAIRSLAEPANEQNLDCLAHEVLDRSATPNRSVDPTALGERANA